MENTEDTIASNGSEPAESSSKAIESNAGDKGKKPIESKESERRGRGSQYTVRRSEPNCDFFVRSGYCRYGSACRFNHPRRRTGRSWTGSRSCQYCFMPGGCRYGNACKFAHCAERTILEPITPSLFSFPVQPEELECPEYICTGYCTFSGICKFQHPPLLTSFPNQQEFSEYFSERLNLSGYINCGFGNFDHRALQLAERFGPPQIPNEPLPSFDLFQSNTPSVFPLQINYNSGYPNPAAANASSPSIQNARNTQAPSMTSTNRTSNEKAHSEEVLEQLLRDPEIIDMIMVPKTPTGLPLRPERPVCFFYDACGLCQNGSSCQYDHPYPYDPSQHRVVATREDQRNRRY